MGIPTMKRGKEIQHIFVPYLELNSCFFLCFCGKKSQNFLNLSHQAQSLTGSWHALHCSAGHLGRGENLIFFLYFVILFCQAIDHKLMIHKLYILYILHSVYTVHTHIMRYSSSSTLCYRMSTSTGSCHVVSITIKFIAIITIITIIVTMHTAHQTATDHVPAHH